MNSSIAAHFHLLCLLHPYYPYLHSLPQSMLPSVVFLGLMVVVSWLIRAEVERVVGGILAETFLGPTISLFVVLVVVLLGRKLAVIMNSGSNTINGLQHQTSGHDSR